MKLGAENLTSSIGKPRSDAAASTSPATRVGVVGLEVCEGGHRGGSPIHPSFAELALSEVGGHGRLPGRPRFEDLKHAAGRLAEEPHEMRVEGPAGAVVSHGHGSLGSVDSSMHLELVGHVHYPGDQRNALTARHAGGSRTSQRSKTKFRLSMSAAPRPISTATSLATSPCPTSFSRRFAGVYWKAYPAIVHAPL